MLSSNCTTSTFTCRITPYGVHLPCISSDPTSVQSNWPFMFRNPYRMHPAAAMPYSEDSLCVGADSLVYNIHNPE